MGRARWVRRLNREIIDNFLLRTEEDVMLSITYIRDIIHSLHQGDLSELFLPLGIIKKSPAGHGLWFWYLKDSNVKKESFYCTEPQRLLTKFTTDFLSMEIQWRRKDTFHEFRFTSEWMSFNLSHGLLTMVCTSDGMQMVYHLHTSEIILFFICHPNRDPPSVYPEVGKIEKKKKARVKFIFSPSFTVLT
jgi:hypothetical protein